MPRKNLRRNRTVIRKKEIVAQVAQESGLSQKNAKAAVDALETVIKDNLGSHNTVNGTGMRKLEPKKTKARNGMNPSTMETMKSPAKITVKCKVGATLKKAAE